MSSGASFEQSGFSFYTVTSMNRELDSGSKAAGNYGLGIRYALSPRVSYFVAGTYSPVTGSVLDFFGESRRDHPLFRALAYGLENGVIISGATKSRVQPFVSLGAGVTHGRVYYSDLIGRIWYGHIAGMVGARVYVGRYFGVQAGFGLSSPLSAPTLSVGPGLGLFYDLKGLKQSR